MMSEMAEARGELFRVTGALTTLEFQGVRVAEVDTATERSPRWTVMELYRITDGPSAGRYVLSIIGCTVVYHHHGSACNTGVPTPSDELPAEAEPCERCTPSLTAGGVDTVDLEEEWRNVQVCDGAQAVRDVLLTTSRGKRTGARGAATLSRPAENLLQRAAQADPAFDPSRFVERL